MPAKRILPPELIPKSLWDSEILRFTALLVDSYREAREQHAPLTTTPIPQSSMRMESVSFFNSDASSTATSKSGPIGGVSDEETRKHFVERFLNGVGRVQYLLLDPRDVFSPISNDLLVTLSTGHVAVLDIPCGTGAASAALISAIVELRASVLAKLPLTISITGGDFSPLARATFSTMMNLLNRGAVSSGVVLDWGVQEWDATRTDSTAKLVDNWFAQAANATEYIVIVPNFSGEGARGEFFKQFSRSLDHIVARLHSKHSTLLCVEPCWRSAQKEYIPKVVSFFNNIAWFVEVYHRIQSGVADETKRDPECAQYEFFDPLAARTVPSNVIINSWKRS